jgi:hypothetical protein
MSAKKATSIKKTNSTATRLFLILSNARGNKPEVQPVLLLFYRARFTGKINRILLS